MRLPMMDDLIVMPPCLCRWEGPGRHRANTRSLPFQNTYQMWCLNSTLLHE
jgi:hypothetical protein